MYYQGFQHSLLPNAFSNSFSFMIKLSAAVKHFALMWYKIFKKNNSKTKHIEFMVKTGAFVQIVCCMASQYLSIVTYMRYALLSFEKKKKKRFRLSKLETIIFCFLNQLHLAYAICNLGRSNNFTAKSNGFDTNAFKHTPMFVQFPINSTDRMKRRKQVALCVKFCTQRIASKDPIQLAFECDILFNI